MTTQWYMDDDFDVPMPEWLADECRQFYGTGPLGIDFAQGLASFLHVKGLEVVKKTQPANAVKPEVAVPPESRVKIGSSSLVTVGGNSTVFVGSNSHVVLGYGCLVIHAGGTQSRLDPETVYSWEAKAWSDDPD